MRHSAGSYTVEAAVLMPLLLAIVIAIMQLCLVLHDRVIVREALEYAVLPIAENKEDGKVYGIDLKNVKEHLLISEVTDADMKETIGEYEAFARVKFKSLVPIYLGSGKSFVREYTAKRKRVYAKEKTILCEILLDTLHVFE